VSLAEGTLPCVDHASFRVVSSLTLICYGRRVIPPCTIAIRNRRFLSGMNHRQAISVSCLAPNANRHDLNGSALEADAQYVVMIGPLPNSVDTSQGLCTEPGDEETAFANGEARNRLRVVAARDGRDDALTVPQDVAVYLAELDTGTTVRHKPDGARHSWLQVLRGDVTLNGAILRPRRWGRGKRRAGTLDHGGKLGESVAFRPRVTMVDSSWMGDTQGS